MDSTSTDEEKRLQYRSLREQLQALVADERHWLPNLANAAALVFQSLPDLNWGGFYLSNSRGDLVLGPFQGRPACIRIGPGKGVCGAAAAQRQSIVVADVRTFAGHIACDAASRSELVAPLIWRDTLVGVLDLDSPLVNRFDEADREGCEQLAEILARACDWPPQASF